MRKDGGISFYYHPAFAYPGRDINYILADRRTGKPTATRRTFADLEYPKDRAEFSYVLRHREGNMYGLFRAADVNWAPGFDGATLDPSLATITLEKGEEPKAALIELVRHVRKLRDEDVIKLRPAIHINILIDDATTLGVARESLTLEDPNAMLPRRSRPR